MPKPTALKRLAGNPGKRPLSTAEPTYPAASTRAPAWLNVGARTHWRRLAPSLIERGLLTAADVDSFALYCTTQATIEACQAVLDREGLVFTTKNGFPTTRPEVAIIQKSTQILRMLAADFGLTPASRPRVHSSVEDDEEDPLEKFLRGTG